MIRPLTQESQLQSLADIPMEKLRPEFVEQIHSLRRKVVQRIKPKQLNSKPLNGEMLFNLAKSYVDSINAGAVPSIESSWSYICRNECQNAIRDSFKIFEQRFYEEFTNRVPMPQEEL
jgi:fructosamine-3-kinase